MIKTAVKHFVPHVGWMYYYKNDEVADSLYKGCFEASEQVFLRRYLRPGDVFLDCGAHAGLYSRIALDLTGPTGFVVAFEPDGETREILSKNLTDYEPGVFEIVPKALWNSDTTLFLNGEGDGMSSHNFTATEAREGDALPVEAVRLDSILEQRSIEHVRFAKVDCEGSEIEVFEGASNYLQSHRIDVLMVEFNELNLQRAGKSTEQLWESINSLGYKLYRYSADDNQLLEAALEGPIYYENLFAISDVDKVRDLLVEEKPDREEICADITRRANACALHKELEEMAYFKEKAELSDLNKAWALRTEKHLAEVQKELDKLSGLTVVRIGNRIERIFRRKTR